MINDSLMPTQAQLNGVDKTRLKAETENRFRSKLEDTVTMNNQSLQQGSPMIYFIAFIVVAIFIGFK